MQVQPQPERKNILEEGEETGRVEEVMEGNYISSALSW